MRKVFLKSVIIIFVTLLLTATVWSSENNRCVRNVYGKIVCPPQDVTCLVNSFSNVIACSPPNGGIVMNATGEMLCGPGKCMVPAFGQAFCSALQGGSVTIDSKGEPVCTGECVPASASACSLP